VRGLLKDALMLAVRSKQVVDPAVVAVEREMPADLVGRRRDDVVVLQISVGDEVANAPPADIEISVRPEIYGRRYSPRITPKAGRKSHTL